MAKDFRATQVETTKIILSGGIASSTIGGIIYSGSVATNRSGGIPASMLSDVGTDVFLFVSGTKSNSDFTRAGVTLFGGDIVVSGTMYAERQVIEVDGIIDGDLIVTGNLLVKPDTNSSISADFRNAANASLFRVDTSNSSVVINEESNSFDFRVETNNKENALLIDGSTDQVLILSGGAAASYDEASGNDVNFYVSGSVGSKGTSIRGTTLFGGDMQISGALHIAGTTGLYESGESVSIILNSRPDIASTSRIVWDTNTDGAYSPDAQIYETGGDLYISGSDDVRIRGNFGDVIVQSGDDIMFRPGDSLTITEDSSASGKFVQVYAQPSVSTFHNVFDIDGSSGIIINDAGESAYDFRVETNNKTHAIFTDASTDQVLILSGGAGVSPNESSGADVNFFVSGTIGSKGTSARGTTLFGGDLVVSGTLQARTNLEVNAAAGISDFIHFGSTAGKEIIASLSSQNQVLILSGGGGAASPNEKNYPDLAFFVSGSIGSKGTAVKGTAVFGGDLVVSGSTTLGTVAGDLLPSIDDTYDLGSTALAWQDLHLEGDVLMTDTGKVETAAGDLIISAAGGQVVVDANTSIVLDADDKNIIFKDAGVTRGSIIANTRLTFSSSAGADIVLDSNGGSIRIEEAGTEFFRITKSANHTVLQPRVADKDIIFAEDGGNEIARFDSSLESFNINTNKRISFDGTSSSTEFISGDGFDLTIGSSNKVLILSGGAPASPSEQLYLDTNFFVSGSIGSKGTAVKGTAVFGGDLVVSGSTTLDTVAAGTWQGTAIASAYLDADTAHLTTNQTLSGEKTFTADLVVTTANHSVTVDVSADEMILAGDTKLSFNDANGDENISADAGGLMTANAGARINATAPIVGLMASTQIIVSSPKFQMFSGNSDKPLLSLECTNPDPLGASLQFVKNGASVADNDVVGTINFISEDDGSAVHTYASIVSTIADMTAGSEGGSISISVASHDGELQPGLTLQDGNAEDEIDVFIANGAASVTTVAGHITVSGSLSTRSAVYRNTGIFTSNFAIDGFSHFSLINTNAGHVTASLQTAAQAGAGRVLVFKDIAGYAATNKILIKPAGSDKVEGINDELVMEAMSGSVSIISDGISNYYVFGERD